MTELPEAKTIQAITFQETILWELRKENIIFKTINI